MATAVAVFLEIFAVALAHSRGAAAGRCRPLVLVPSKIVNVHSSRRTVSSPLAGSSEIFRADKILPQIRMLGPGTAQFMSLIMKMI